MTYSGKGSRFSYGAKELNPENGYFKMGARLYDPAIGRFLSRDPLAELFPNHSSYSYAFNSPLNFNDPTGLAPETEKGDKLQGALEAAQFIVMLAIESGLITVSGLPPWFAVESTDEGSRTGSGDAPAGGGGSGGTKPKKRQGQAPKGYDYEPVQRQYFQYGNPDAQGERINYGGDGGVQGYVTPRPYFDDRALLEGNEHMLAPVIPYTKPDLGQSNAIEGALYASIGPEMKCEIFCPPSEDMTSSIGGATDISQQGLEFIAGFEGFSSTVYKVGGKGNPTIGFGHEVLPGEDFSGGITKAQAYQLLKQDAQIAINKVNRYITVPLTQNQFDAVVSFAFNVGLSRSATPSLINMINAGNYNPTIITNTFGLYNKQGRLVLPGLTRRRDAEADLFLYGY